MTWRPVAKDELLLLIARDLARCAPHLREFFERVVFDPVRWQQSPWGLEGGGFWALAAIGNLVLWYNDIEDGFNVSHFESHGVIPPEEYWCNQDDLCVALRRLAHQGGIYRDDDPGVPRSPYK